RRKGTGSTGRSAGRRAGPGRLPARAGRLPPAGKTSARRWSSPGASSPSLLQGRALAPLRQPRDPPQVQLALGPPALLPFGDVRAELLVQPEAALRRLPGRVAPGQPPQGRAHGGEVLAELVLQVAAHAVGVKGLVAPD